MFPSELFWNFLRMSVNDLVRDVRVGVFVAWCAGFSAVQNRPTSIQASQPIEIGSAWR